MQIDGYYGEQLALELINSERWYGRRPAGGADLLEDARWLHGYLARWELGGVPPATAREVSTLAALRGTLRSAFTDVAAKRAIAADDLSALNGFLAGSAVRRRIEGEGGSYALALEPATRDWNWVAAEIAASFGELLEAGDLERMKLCENPECLCAFYDESKNRSRRWCYPEVCGNLYKVRQFRERERQRARRS